MSGRDFGPPPLLRHGSGYGEGSFRGPIWEGDPVAAIEDQIARDQRERENDAVADLAQNALAARAKAAEQALHPRVVAAGPMEWTTGGGLERWPSMCFDVNGYYATLGVDWRATKRQIRRRYQAMRGDRSARVTYIVKQLKNAQIRAAYDACQPGSVFFDQYVADYVRQQMLEDSRRENGRSLTADSLVALDLEDIDLTHLINKGFTLDKEGLVDQDGWSGEESPEGATRRWRWGYYLWRTEIYDIQRLRDWQEALLGAAHERGFSLQLSIGLIGDSEESFQVERIGYRTVVFLHVDETSNFEDLARRAIDRVAQTIQQ